MDQVKHILVVAAGLTPAIITETLQFLLYCNPGGKLTFTHLSQNPTVKLRIDDIYIITTSLGKAKIVNDLLENGKFYKFCEEFGIDWLNLDKSNIIVLKNKNGSELDDIKTIEDNLSASDQILNFLREMTEDRNSVIHCSIAGGRKSMDIYFAFGMQFYGRELDKMYHVLVNPPFDRPDFVDPSGDPFFYIPKKPVIFSNQKIRKLSTEAEIHLSEIPYIHLRQKLEKFIPEFFYKNKSYQDLVKIAQDEIDLLTLKPKIKLNFKETSIEVENLENVKLTPTEFFIYSYFALSKKLCKRKHKADEDCDRCFVSFEGKEQARFGASRVIKILQSKLLRAIGHSSREGRVIKEWIENGIPRQSLRDKISEVNLKIARTIPYRSVQEVIKISNIGRYKGKYGLKIEKDMIEIVD
ncbi:MAG: CRISPR-associated ring nuclease Csm6 [Candidatus Kryptonium sp.]|nr:CRISPR-associated ring nuclease Csm6 [Candidatus Kryptonium sp.]